MEFLQYGPSLPSEARKERSPTRRNVDSKERTRRRCLRPQQDLWHCLWLDHMNLFWRRDELNREHPWWVQVVVVVIISQELFTQSIQIIVHASLMKVPLFLKPPKLRIKLQDQCNKDDSAFPSLEGPQGMVPPRASWEGPQPVRVPLRVDIPPITPSCPSDQWRVKTRNLAKSICGS